MVRYWKQTGIVLIAFIKARGEAGPAWRESKRMLRREEEKERLRAQFGTGEVGGARNHKAPVHGVDGQGNPITAAFGRDGTKKEGHTYLKDGHAGSNEEFWGTEHDKRHDHYDGRGDGTRRGRYTGYGS